MRELRHQSARAPGRAAFTLVEVVITIAILTAVTFSSLLVAVPVSRQTRLSREVEIVNAEVWKTLEEIRLTGMDQLVKDYPPGMARDQNRSKQIKRLKNGLIYITTTYLHPGGDPLLVQVEAAWDSQDSGSMTRDFFTLRTR